MNAGKPMSPQLFGAYVFERFSQAFADTNDLSDAVRERLPVLVSRVGESQRVRDAVYADRGALIPAVLLLSVTGNCNLHCAHCYTRKYPKTDMSLSLAARIVREAYSLGVSLIVLTGGEPLLHPDLARIPEAHPDLPFLIFSNGIEAPEFLRKEPDIPNLLWAISLDGPRPYHDFRRGAGAFDAAVAALDALKSRRIPFGFAATLSAENAERATSLDFVTMLAGKGCRAGIFLEQIPHSPCVPPLSGQTRISDCLAGLRERSPIPIVAFPEDEKRCGGCQGAGRGLVHVSPEGFLEPCPAALVAADSLEHVSLEEALSSPFQQAFREIQKRCANCEENCPYPENQAYFRRELARHGGINSDSG